MKNIKNISMGVIFVSVNIALFLFSYNNATFIEGADATQYLDPALSFLEYGKFLSNDGSLFTFGTPLYSILLAISIYSKPMHP